MIQPGSRLAHYEILAVLDEGMRFLVLELVEGPTLGDRLVAGPIPVEESLDLAIQIAEAIEAAHDRGIVRRDPKPGNVKITPVKSGPTIPTTWRTTVVF